MPAFQEIIGSYAENQPPARPQHSVILCDSLFDFRQTRKMLEDVETGYQVERLTADR